MNDEIGDPGVLRHYLLGILEDDVVLSRLEMRLLTNDEFADEVTAVEYGLIEEYLDGEMSMEDSSRFEQHFLAAPERKRQLSLTQNLWKYAAKTETVAQPKRSFLDRFPLLSIQGLRFAALAVVVTGAGFIVWRFAIYQSDADRASASFDKPIKDSVRSNRVLPPCPIMSPIPKRAAPRKTRPTPMLSAVPKSICSKPRRTHATLRPIMLRG